jgi:hypothetical protein
MAAKGRYEVDDHASVKGLLSIYFYPPGQARRDPRPLVNIGPEAVPLLAEALAEWELAHQVPPTPAPSQEAPRRRLRAVNDDGVL